MQTMERKLIQFAKAHGYLVTAIMMCLGSVILVKKIPSVEHILLHFFIWLAFPTIIIFAVLLENAKFARFVKWLYIGVNIVGVILLKTQSQQTLTFTSSLLCAIVAATLYGGYVLHFLQKLFVYLKKRRGQTTFIMTTIVCGSPPAQAAQAAPEQTQPQLPPEPEEQNQPESPPPTYETVTSIFDTTGRPKEFSTTRM